VDPDLLLVGEVNGRPIAGFDYGNSPSAFLGCDLTGRRLVQRTTAGTQGVVRSRRANILLGASLCCARATVDYVRQHPAPSITLVISGARPDDPPGRPAPIPQPDRPGDEDAACADYLEALLRDQTPDLAGITRRVHHSEAARKFLDPAVPEFSPADVECALDIDRFDFALPVRRRDGLLVMESAGSVKTEY